MVIFLHGIDSLKFIHTTYGEKYAIKIGSSYLTEKQATEEVEEIKKFVQMEKSIVDKKRSILEEIKFYNKEIILAISVGIAFSLSFYPLFYGMTLILTTKNIDDDDEVRITKIFGLAGTFINFGFTMVLTIFPIILRRRKLAFMLGGFLTMLAWGCILISNIFDFFWIAKCVIPLFYVSISGLMSSSLNAIFSDSCPSHIMILGFNAAAVFNIAQLAIGPFIFTADSSKLRNIIALASIMVIMFLLLVYLYFMLIETAGLTKR